MKNLYSIAVAVLSLPLLLVVSEMYGGSQADEMAVRPELKVDLQPQERTERVWRDIRVDSVVKIGASDVSLLRPLQVVPSEMGLLVVDYGDMRLKVFDWSGQQIQSYGRSGRGPGEFSNPTDVDVAQSTIWVADGGARRLSRIQTDDIETIPMKAGALRVAPIDSTAAFVMTSTPTEDGLFTQVSGGETDNTFGQIIDNQARDAIVLDGELEFHEGNLLYSSYYSGFILSYDKNGNLDFAVETLNHKALPEVQITKVKNSTVRRVKNRDYVNAQMSVDKNGIHLFSFKGSVAESALVIDTYSLEDGSYQYSTKVEQDIRRIRAFHDTHVGIENDTLVTAYWYSLK